MSECCFRSNSGVDFHFGGARLPHGHNAFSWTAIRTTLKYFRVLRPPSRTQVVAAVQGFALNLGSIVWPTMVHHKRSCTLGRGSAAFRPFQPIRRYRFWRLARTMRKFRSLAPPTLGLLRPFPYLGAYGLKPWAILGRRFAAFWEEANASFIVCRR